MTHLVDKDAIVAEIEKRIKEIDEIGTYLSPKGVLTNLLCHLDTLEVKEVDLEKEFCDYLERNFKIGMTGMLLSNNGDPINTIKLFDFVRHFFELGLKAQKGE